ncbi:MAG: ABC transporter permease [Trueperaceae bacterium]|nr:ABC transporter permease [Trueperaceae bacterium]
MTALLRMEWGKLFRLSSVRAALVLLLVFPLLWAYAPGIFEVYGFFLVSGFQVPALSLLSSMEFLMPLLVAIIAAELVGMESVHGTLPTVLLRPVTRSSWLLAKLLVLSVLPFLAMAYFLIASLAAGAPYGFDAFVGGTGLGEGGLIGQGTMSPGDAAWELLGAYLLAAVALIPVALLSVLATVVTMNAASGALATLAVLIVMQLLVVFPSLEPFLLTRHLSAYTDPVASVGWVVTLIALYSAAFAAAAVVLFERKDF